MTVLFNFYLISRQRSTCQVTLSPWFQRGSFPSLDRSVLTFMGTDFGTGEQDIGANLLASPVGHEPQVFLELVGIHAQLFCVVLACRMERYWPRLMDAVISL